MQYTDISDNVFNTVFDKLPVFVIAFCEEGKVLFYNKMAETTCGKQIEGLKFSDIFAYEYRSAQDDTNELKYESRIGGNYYSIVDFYSNYGENTNVRILIGYDITDIKNYVFNHNNRSMLDSMTGVFNREVGLDSLKELINQVEFYQDFFSVAYVDLDNLKYINDNFGHMEGDAYVFAVRDAIHEFTRKEDIVSRMGGDEFLIIFPRLTQDEAKKKMENISGKLASLSENDIPYRISYGIHEVNSEETLDIDHILKSVDEKMYVMKAENRTKYGLQLRLFEVGTVN